MFKNKNLFTIKYVLGIINKRTSKVLRRSARAVDRSGLENRRTCERSVGSNPTSSSILKEPEKALF